MSQRPWLPLYIADYLADTTHLSTTEHGAYLLLIMHYWRSGGLPGDDRQLACITNLTLKQWRKHRPVLRAFFMDDHWRHKRLEQELAETAKLSAAGRVGGLASARSRAKKAHVDASSSGGHNAPDPTPQKERNEDKKSNESNKASYTIDQRSFDEITNPAINEPTNGSATIRQVLHTSHFTKKDNHQPLAQNSVPREASKVPPSAAAVGLEFSKEGSPEDHFWEAATTLTQRGISRGRSAQLLKLNYGDFDAALAQLRDTAAAHQPAAYLGAIIAKLKTKQAPIASTVGGDLTEPAFVREYRAEGYNIEHRRKNRWWIAGDLYDETGRVVGC